MNPTAVELLSEPERTELHVRTLSGTQTLERLGPALDELCDATAAPVTARRPWLATWVRCHPEFEPLAVALLDSRERLAAAALLGRRRRRGFEEFVALGHGPSDQARLPARTDEAAEALAAAVVGLLAQRGGRWRMTLLHLPWDDRAAQCIASGLACARLVPGDVSPALRFSADRSVRNYVSQNHYRQVRRMRNRMQREGLDPLIEHLRDAQAVRAVMPEIEATCRARDLQARGRSALERGADEAFFREVILEHAARGELELTTLRLGGELAAYSVGFLDRGSLRVWSCKVAPAWQRFGAGRVANDAAVRRAAADPACVEVDWMRGQEAFKHSVSNQQVRSIDVLAWSSPSMELLLDAERRLRVSIKGVVARHAWLDPALRSARRLQASARRLRRLATGAAAPECHAGGLRFERVDDARALASDWEDLAERVRAGPFSRPGWIAAWWAAFGGGRAGVWTARDARTERLRALLPVSERFGAIDSPTNWHTPEFELLAESPQVAQLLLAHLLRRRPRHLCLGFLPDAQAELLERAAAAQGMRVLRRTLLSSPFVAIDGDWAAYERGLGRRVRSELARRERRLCDSGRLVLEISAGERLEVLLEEGLRVEGSGWKGERGTAMGSSADTRRFYGEIARWAAARGWLRLAFLRLDGRALAFDLSFETQGRHYLLKTGYDPAWREMGPGKLLRYRMLERAFQAGLSAYEFLGEAQPWKAEWTATVRPLQQVQVFAPTPAGSLDWSAQAYARPVVRRLRREVRALRARG